MQATALPVVVIAAAIVGAYQLAGLYGVGVAVMAQLAMTGLIVALDAFGPVTDNAGGIAEMAELDESVRGVTDRSSGREHDEGRDEGLRDRVGRSRRSRPLRRLHLGAREPGLNRLQLSRPMGDCRSLHRGLMPFLFSSLAMQAVGRVGGRVVEEVRRQFREIPGIMTGEAKPDTGPLSTSSPATRSRT